MAQTSCPRINPAPVCSAASPLARKALKLVKLIESLGYDLYLEPQHQSLRQLEQASPGPTLFTFQRYWHRAHLLSTSTDKDQCSPKQALRISSDRNDSARAHHTMAIAPRLL